MIGKLKQNDTWFSDIYKSDSTVCICIQSSLFSAMFNQLCCCCPYSVWSFMQPLVGFYPVLAYLIVASSICPSTRIILPLHGEEKYVCSGGSIILWVWCLQGDALLLFLLSVLHVDSKSPVLVSCE